MGVEWGTVAIDDEGCPTQRNTLIEDGVLTDYVDHLRSARRQTTSETGESRVTDISLWFG